MSDHHRVSPLGRHFGALTARMTASGEARLNKGGLLTVEAPGLRAEMCPSCACRKGTVPNGCLQTQLDFLKTLADGEPFYCHAPRDGKICAGWLRARAEWVARPVPQKLLDALAKHEYSPPDEAE